LPNAAAQRLGYRWSPSASSRPDRQRYYLDQTAGPVSAAQALTTGVEDYYLGGPEAAGRWQGRGALALALEGRVEGADLHDVLNGVAPRTGETLRSRGSVAGFDVTFSAPKSVSILFGVGDPAIQAAVRAAHDRAVGAAFDYFERSTAFGRRGAGGAEVVRGDGLVAAAFVHRTSRAGDPQLHTHVLVANLVRAEDRRWSALDGRLVYAHARTAGFLYQAELRAELTRSLGVAWGPVSKGSAEVRGVSDRVVRAFSRRRAEIEAAMELHGSRGHRAARVAALDTRRAKDRTVRPEALAPEWRRRAARFGLDPSRIDRLLRRRTLAKPDWEPGFEQLAAASGLTQHRSSFGRRDVLQALCELAGQGATVYEIEQAADAFLRRPTVVRLMPSRGRQIEPLYSTVELLETERRALSIALALRGAGRGRATEHALEAALAARPHLSDEQRVMVERLARDGDGVAVVVGAAGSGKTTALAAAREAWEATGFPVRGSAVARKAAHKLRQTAGIDATSVAALLRRSRPLEPGTMLVVDEASMLGTRAFAELVMRVDAARGKLVVVGDTHQLPAIEAGGMLGALATRLPAIELLDNRRQEQRWEREAVELIRDGEADQALNLYERHGRLHVGRDSHEVVSRLLADWHAAGDPDGCLMIAHFRADVRELNGRARAVMRATGRLGQDELVTANARFAVGDRVVIKCNSARLDVRNGERGVVEALDLRAGALSVRLEDRRAHLDAAFLTCRTQDGRPALEHGYAMTAHAAQGMTCRHALVLARDDAYREWTYTTMTRATEANRLYVIAERNRARDEFAPAEPARSARALLAAALTRTRAQELALDRLHPSRDSGIER
jgi:conjugative relaxase-like TrwC/TraI family protein